MNYIYHSQNDDSRLDLEDVIAAQEAESARHIHQQLKVDICQYCKGFGEILNDNFEDEYYMSAEQLPCPHCRGTGKQSTI